jgi:hypothetical protein
MSLNVTALLNNRIAARQSNWENDFDRNMSTFSKEISEGIAKKVFSSLNNALNDPYKELPNKQKPLSYYFSFEILNPQVALSLKELASKSADLPPFKEWFEKFCIPNQKVSKGNDSLSSEKRIDREYFQGRMFLIGQNVKTQLKNLFKNSTLATENSGLKIKVKWYQQSDQLVSNPSNFHDNSIDVTAWIEEKNQDLKLIAPAVWKKTRSLTISALENRENRCNRCVKNGLLTAGVVAVIGTSFLLMSIYHTALNFLIDLRY